MPPECAARLRRNGQLPSQKFDRLRFAPTFVAVCANTKLALGSSNEVRLRECGRGHVVVGGTTESRRFAFIVSTTTLCMAA
jgi:hypothetical protein